eukprot:TRINITY_DN958_c0_g1_i1.p1 TRINITY_DN958_c0_g1~~TRINITY_DN958_c0_g1_i1.p1  ORF type:complete len:440 (-),score=82.07 TRINITY_DN958_c0_g1_i1:141-1460(-)
MKLKSKIESVNQYIMSYFYRNSVSISSYLDSLFLTFVRKEIYKKFVKKESNILMKVQHGLDIYIIEFNTKQSFDWNNEKKINLRVSSGENKQFFNTHDLLYDLNKSISLKQSVKLLEKLWLLGNITYPYTWSKEISYNNEQIQLLGEYNSCYKGNSEEFAIIPIDNSIPKTELNMEPQLQIVFDLIRKRYEEALDNKVHKKIYVHYGNIEHEIISHTIPESLLDGTNSFEIVDIQIKEEKVKFWEDKLFLTWINENRWILLYDALTFFRNTLTNEIYRYSIFRTKHNDSYKEPAYLWIFYLSKIFERIGTGDPEKIKKLFKNMDGDYQFVVDVGKHAMLIQEHKEDIVGEFCLDPSSNSSPCPICNNPTLLFGLYSTECGQCDFSYPVLYTKKNDDNFNMVDIRDTATHNFIKMKKFSTHYGNERYTYKLPFIFEKKVF